MQSHESWNHIFQIKIGFIVHFQSFIAFLCILIQLKRNHSRGHVACSPSARGDLSVVAVSLEAHSEASGGSITRWTRGALGSFREGPKCRGTRDTWHSRTASGGVVKASAL